MDVLWVRKTAQENHMQHHEVITNLKAFHMFMSTLEDEGSNTGFPDNIVLIL